MFPDNMDFRDLEKLLDEEEMLDPNKNKLKGKKSAQLILDNNRITDEHLIQLILESGFGYSEFQQIQYYDQDIGFYENGFSYKDDMPMIPQMASPFYGIILAELFGGLIPQINPFGSVPTFLSLGAGAGYLDYDLIYHLTGPKFQIMHSNGHEHNIKQKSEFIVTDLTQNSVKLLKKELSGLPLKKDIFDRILIGQLDASDFDFSQDPDIGKRPYLVSYSNELIDALPTEPIIKIQEKLYAVRLMPYLEEKTESDEKLQQVSSRLDKQGLIDKRQAIKMIEKKQVDDLAYIPVLIPLEKHDSLYRKVQQTGSARNIDNPNFNGLYPLNLGLENMFSSIRRSSEHGISVVVDYCSFGDGMHNYNKALNIFGWLRAGKQDLDFQIDPEQVMESAAMHGMRCISCESFGEILQNAESLVGSLDKHQYKRSFELNNSFSGNMKRDLFSMMARLKITTEIAKGYKMMTFIY